MTHAFFEDTGGFELQTRLSSSPPVDYKPFLMDAKQVHYFVHNGYTPYSTLRVEKQIFADRDKIDGLLRAIIMCQIV